MQLSFCANFAQATMTLSTHSQETQNKCHCKTIEQHPRVSFGVASNAQVFTMHRCEIRKSRIAWIRHQVYKTNEQHPGHRFALNPSAQQPKSPGENRNLGGKSVDLPCTLPNAHKSVGCAFVFQSFLRSHARV